MKGDKSWFSGFLVSNILFMRELKKRIIHLRIALQRGRIQARFRNSLLSLQREVGQRNTSFTKIEF
jgi:hypothetical protein